MSPLTDTRRARMPDGFARLTLPVAMLTFAATLLGAYVRLADAALGWPGCYGQLTAPTNSEAMAAAAFPDRPLEHPKAWKQMLHRYLAGTLGRVAIPGLAVTALAPARAPSLLVGLTGRFRPDAVVRDA